MLKNLINILIISIFSFCFIASSQMNQINSKIEKFKNELYAEKSKIIVIEYYNEVNVKNLKNEEIRRIYKNLFSKKEKLSKFLFLYFSNQLIFKNFDYKQKFYHGFLYTDGKGYFNEYIKIIELENKINETIVKIINSDINLARIEIFHNGFKYFSKSFEVVDGFEAILDIDEFRILNSNHGNVLGIEHGERLDTFNIEKLGYFENNQSYYLNLPIAYKGYYIADIAFTIYK